MSSSKRHEGTVSGNDRGFSSQRGGKDKPHSGNGRGKHTGESANAKRSNPPPVRAFDSGKGVLAQNSKPTAKVTQAPPPENLMQTQMRGPPPPSSNPEPANPPRSAAPIVQPQPQPHFQYRSFSSQQNFGIPPRTHSAPPNLQEQEKQTPLFYPEKSHNTQPFKPFPYGQTFYVPGTGFPMQPPPDYGMPNVPYMPPQVKAANPPIRKPSQPKSIIAIIDPDSNEEVVITNSPPKTRPPASNPQNTKLNSGPGGILPEFSMTVSKTSATEAPTKEPAKEPAKEPTKEPVKEPVKEPTKEPAREPAKESPLAEPIQEMEAPKAVKADTTLATQGRRPSSGKLRQEFRVKSPKPEPKAEETAAVSSPQVETNPAQGSSDAQAQAEEVGSEGEDDEVAQDSVQVAPPKKKSLKELLKKADGGNFKAYTFDAYSGAAAQSQAPGESAQTPAPPQAKQQPSSQPPESEEEDDWESKDESELMNLRRASPFPLGENNSEAKGPISISATLTYPGGMWRPDNQSGQKVYDRSFLLQFQPLCTERPPALPDMSEVLGLDDKGEQRDSKSNTQWRATSANQPGGAQSRGFRDPRNRGSNDITRSGPPGFSPLNPRNVGRNGPSTPNMGRGNKMKKGQRSTTPEITLVATPGRWEPSSRQKGQANDHKAILKTVKGVLNKLTEEKFDALSDEIVNVGVINDELLKDIIKLVFDKALSEPKFGKMYAELCRKLSASPNFSLDDKAQTFKRVLLNRCQEEFESSFKGSRGDPNIPESTSPEEKQAYEEKLMLEKKKMLGNITFIGELYKIRMLTEPIMHECLTKLLGDIKNPSHDDIEALCRLMTSIGSYIDHPKAKNYMDQYFSRMKELSRNKTLPSRIRFMLQDVIELRNHKWVIQRENNALNVTKNSETKAAPAPASSSSSRPRDKPPASAPQRVISPAPARSVQPGEWEQVPAKSGSKHRPQRPTQEETKAQPSFLGPMGSSQSQGARGWKQDQQDKDGRANRAPAESPKPPAASSADLESKTELLLKEYLSCGDVAEAITCVKELNSPQYLPDVVNKAISMSLEKGPEDRDQMSKLFAALHEEGLLATEVFQKGVEMVLEIMEDLVIDIPNCPSHLATFVANAIVDDYFSMSLLESLLKPFVSADGAITASSLASGVFLSIAEQTSMVKLRELYRKSKLDLLRLLPADQRNAQDLVAFLEQHELVDLLPQVTYGGHLEKLLKERYTSQSILVWIESVPQDIQEDVTFCRHFFRCVLQQVVSRGPEKEAQTFKELVPPLKALLASNFNLQLNSLFETQLFCHNSKFPQGLMERVFDYLFKSMIVTADVFIVWTEDEGVTEGKKEALAQTNRWLQKLREQIEDEDRD